MPRTRTLSYYPKSFFEITRKVMLEGKKWEVEVKPRDGRTARKLAEKMRGQFYAFVGAGKTAQAEMADMQLAIEGEKKRLGYTVTEITPLQRQNAEVGALAERVLVTIEDRAEGEGEEVLMTFQKRDESWQSLLLLSGRAVESKLEQGTKDELEQEFLRRHSEPATPAPAQLADPPPQSRKRASYTEIAARLAEKRAAAESAEPGGTIASPSPTTTESAVAVMAEPPISEEKK